MDKTDSLLRFITCGSVDDGKSTLIGRLLYDSKTILSDTLNQIEKTSHKRGLSAVDLSLLTDGLQAEREQGITPSMLRIAIFQHPQENISLLIHQGMSNTQEIW